MTAAAIVFWLAVGMLVYVYFGFPLLLGLAARALGRTTRCGDRRPTVTVLVAAHQEAAVIADKLDNFERVDYPPDKLQMLVVSDGSDDGTDDILVGRAGARIHYLRQEPRQGKASALALGLQHVDSEIVVFTDANVMFEPDAIKLLVRHFEDPNVGVVTGRVDLVDRKLGFAQSENAYYRYERFLQENESRLASVVGVDGAMYAARRALVVPPPAKAILDDFVLAMEIARRGHRIVYEPEALAREDAAPSMVEEFRRKGRVAAGAFQSLFNGWGVPGAATPALTWCYVSHKVLRWLSPIAMLAGLAANAWLALGSPAWALLLAGQLAFYGLAIAGLVTPGARASRLVAVPMYFVLMNAAFVRGLWLFMRGRASVRWARTQRAATG